MTAVIVAGCVIRAPDVLRNESTQGAGSPTLVAIERNDTPVVRERYWITFQPGEIRACDGCHGVNHQNQAGQPAAQNTALALRSLLARWRDGHVDPIFANGLEPR